MWMMLGMLHAMADMREVDILAVNYNEVYPSGIAAIDTTSIWYGRRLPSAMSREACITRTRPGIWTH